MELRAGCRTGDVRAAKLAALPIDWGGKRPDSSRGGALMFFRVPAASNAGPRKFHVIPRICGSRQGPFGDSASSVWRTVRSTMETTAEQSSDSVEHGQDGGSYSDKQLALPSKKRSANFYSDEGGSVAKYRKLAEDRIITAMAEEKPEYNTLVSDISSDEFSNSEGNNNGEKDVSDSVLTESSEACKFECVNNGNMSVEEQCQKCMMDTVSESDGDSVDISPQKELPILEGEALANIIKEKQKVMQKFILISSAAKFHRPIIHTSQFSCNEEPEENNGEVNDLSIVMKQSNSQIPNTICMKKERQEEINQAELPSTSAHEEIIPDMVQENNMKQLLSNEQFTIITEISDKNSSIIVKSNDAIVDESEIQTGIGVQNNVNDVNSTSNQNYIEEHGTSDESHFYSSENLHQSSNTKDSAAEQNFSSETSRANSVSDLNLAQLVLSLKQDIQVLTKKIERQETILDAVAHVQEISLTPLFSPSFPEKYNLKVPFNTIEEFDKFNQDLATDQKFCNEFITSLCSYIDNNVSLAKNILTMMRNYMSKDLVTLYTASKATGNKMVLKDTLFGKCMLQATKMTVRNGLLPLEHEKAFVKGLGIVVTGAKGWHTHDEEKK